MGNCCSDSSAADGTQQLTEEERSEQRERVRAAAEARAARYSLLSNRTLLYRRGYLQVRYRATPSLCSAIFIIERIYQCSSMFVDEE
jgi:hypothetical protein